VDRKHRKNGGIRQLPQFSLTFQLKFRFPAAAFIVVGAALAASK
jgi:hypothetical protein